MVHLLLNYSGKQRKKKLKNYPRLVDHEITQYLEVAKNAAHFESLALALIFLSIAAFCLFSSFTFISPNILGTVSYVLPVIIIAIALGCFIHGRLIMREYKLLKSNSI